MNSTCTDPDQTARREAYAIAVVTLAGAILRLWRIDRLGLTHFDEGIYALSGLWIFRPHGLWDLDPSVIPYAPPGTPIWIGLSYLFLGASDFAAIAPSLVFGLLTIPLVAWIGRRSFGPGAGGAAAAMIAFSGPHIAFSRMALTDVSFLFFWLLAIALGMRYIEKPRIDTSIAFGLAVGLAQNLKYNGILTGLIVAFVAAIDAFVSMINRRESAWKRTIAWGNAAAIVAAFTYLPWYRFVERTSGYANLLAHQRGYFKGFAAWPAIWKIQMEQGVALSGGLWGSFSWVGVAAAVAWLMTAYTQNGIRFWNTKARNTPARFCVGLFIAAAAFGSIPMLAWWLGVACLPVLLVDRRRSVRIIACWLIVMSILTPLYHPYARLWLPLHGVGWLVVAAIIVSAQSPEIVERSFDFLKQHPKKPFFIVQASFASIAIFCFILFSKSQLSFISHPADSSELLAASDDLGRAVRELEKETPGRDYPIVCFTSPVVRWYLLLDGFRSIAAASLEDFEHNMASTSCGIVDTSVSRHEPEGSRGDRVEPANEDSSTSSIALHEHSQVSRSRYRLILGRRYRVNLPTQLDWIGGVDNDSRVEAIGSRSEPANRLLLYRRDP